MHGPIRLTDTDKNVLDTLWKQSLLVKKKILDNTIDFMVEVCNQRSEYV